MGSQSTVIRIQTKNATTVSYQVSSIATHVLKQIRKPQRCRWAPLLKIFHARWRGFGATLLVRLVESLLDNASLNEGGEGASGGVGGQRGRGGGAGGRRGKEGSGGGNAGGDVRGLKRQSAFIGLWVRHLLSRRWHLQAGEAST